MGPTAWQPSGGGTMTFVPCLIHGHHDAESPEATSCTDVVPGQLYRARYDAETEALFVAANRRAS